MQHTFDLPAFRASFPAFENATRYPDPYVTSAWDTSVILLGDRDNCRLSGDAKQHALNLMTAHLLETQGPLGQAKAGAAPALGALTSATVDKVTVARVAPPVKSMWGYWLGSTSYGVQLYALLRVRVAGGFYAVGRAEGAMFRRAPGPGAFRR